MHLLRLLPTKAMSFLYKCFLDCTNIQQSSCLWPLKKHVDFDEVMAQCFVFSWAFWTWCAITGKKPMTCYLSLPFLNRESGLKHNFEYFSAIGQFRSSNTDGREFHIKIPLSNDPTSPWYPCLQGTSRSSLALKVTWSTLDLVLQAIYPSFFKNVIVWYLKQF